MTTTDTAVELARLYVADDEHPNVYSSLLHLGLTRVGSIGNLALLLMEHGSQDMLDGLLCDIDRLDRATDEHDMCCSYACPCSRSNTSFVHPTCERCDLVRIDLRDQAVSDLLSLLPTDIRQHLEAA